MSKHCKHEHEECCYTMPMGGYGYGMMGYGGGQGGGCGSNYGGWGIRWIYALLVLIVIVLQFARKDRGGFVAAKSDCDDTVVAGSGFFDGDQIDRSVLFIIVVFLLILCAGCWTGGYANYGATGSQGYGY